MTAAKAAQIRVQRIQGDLLSNRERREKNQASEHRIWTLDLLWSEYKRARPGLKGISRDENRYLNHLKPHLATKQPRDLSPFDIDRIRITLAKTKKPATVRNVLELLRRLINFGVNKRLCAPLPFKIEMPRVHNLKTEDLSPDQLTRLFEAIKEDPHAQAGPMMKMALFKWEHIDFDRGFISIVDPKGGTDEKIPLNDMARALLESHPRTDSPYVYPGRDGRQRTDINKQVNHIKQKAGLPKGFRPLHGLRHVYASITRIFRPGGSVHTSETPHTQVSHDDAEIRSHQGRSTEEGIQSRRKSHREDDQGHGNQAKKEEPVEAPVGRPTARDNLKVAQQTGKPAIFVGLAFQRKAKRDCPPA